MFRRILAWLLPVAFLSAFCGLALAGRGHVTDYHNGYANYGGHYWYKGDQAYTRTKHYYPTTYYYYNGYYYPNAQSYYYDYSPYYEEKKTEYTEKPVAYSSTWKEELVKLAKSREDYMAFQKALDGLGIPKPDYGQSPFFKSYHQSLQLSGAGAQGQTVYGYQTTYQNLKDPYGSLDMNVLFQQASTLTRNAQALSGQAHTEFLNTVKETGANAARVSEIRAKAELLRAAAPPDSSRTEVRSATYQSAAGGAVGGGGSSPPPDFRQMAPAGDIKTFMADVARPACAKCHTGKDAKGKFDVESLPSASEDTWKTVVARVFSDNPEKVMPPPKQGALTTDAKVRFITKK